MTEILAFTAPAGTPASGGAAVATDKGGAGKSVFAALLSQLQNDGTQTASGAASATDLLQQLQSVVTPRTNGNSKMPSQLSASDILSAAASGSNDADGNALQASQNGLALNNVQLPALLLAQIAAQVQAGQSGTQVQTATDGKSADKPGLTAEQLSQLAALSGDGSPAASGDPKFAQLLAGALASQGQAKPPAQGNVPAQKQPATSTGATTVSTTNVQNGVVPSPATSLDDKSAVQSTNGAGTQQNQQQSLNQSLDFKKALDAAGTGQAGYVPAQPGFTTELMQVQAPQVGSALAQQVPLDALAVQIARKFEQGSSQFEISLHPAELGKLDISLNVSQDGRVHAVLRAERADTLDLLRQDAGNLASQLRQAGLDVGSNSLSFQLSQGGNQRPQANSANFGNSIFQDDASASADIVKTSYVAVRKPDGLDIHV